MDRLVNFDFSGRPYTAYCPAAAVFDIYEKWGVCSNIVETTGFFEDTRDGWDACCWLLAEFCRWGEILRRKAGHDPRPMLSVDELLLASPVDMPRLRLVVMDTLAAGFRREISDEGENEVDLVLQELEAAEKKAPPQGRFARLTWLRRPVFSGTGRRTP